MKEVSIFSPHSWQEKKRVYFPKCQTIPLTYTLLCPKLFQLFLKIVRFCWMPPTNKIRLLVACFLVLVVIHLVFKKSNLTFLKPNLCFFCWFVENSQIELLSDFCVLYNFAFIILSLFLIIFKHLATLAFLFLYD